MMYVECEVPEKIAYCICIGDLHFADPAFSKESYRKLLGYIDWVKKNKNARVILGGDLFNLSTRESKTSPFGQRMSVNDEMKELTRLFTPIKKQIVGAIEGNHELRAIDFLDLSLTETLCGKLDIPYLGYSGVVRFKVGKHNNKGDGGQWRQNYTFYCHHTTGAGRAAGASLNAVEKLATIIEQIDAYIGFHSHTLSCTAREIFYPNFSKHKIDKRRVWMVSCGSYIEWANSYAEAKMFPPKKLGSPKATLSGTKKHDLHFSL